MTQQSGQQYLASILLQQRILEAISIDPPIGYSQLQEKTHLSGSDLDGWLLELEALGVITGTQTSNIALYCRVSNAPEKEWYSVTEAATYLSVSKRTVQELIHDGEKIAYRIGRGGHHKIRRMDLDSPMHRNDPTGLTELSAAEDLVLAELWDNKQDAAYDRL